MEDISEASGYGHRDENGIWHPPGGASISPFFKRSLRLGKILKYIFGWGGYLWPWHAFYAILGLVTSYCLLPGFVFANPASISSIVFILGKNLVLIWAMYGSLHLVLYMWKLNGSDRKFNNRWLEQNKRKFLFNDQVLDNVFWSCVSGGLIWTAYEVTYLWSLSQNLAPVLSFKNNPLWFVLLFLILPFYRDTHFYLIHRLIHWKPLLRNVHHIHHHNPNPGPWSGLAMHPVEHLLYFSNVLIFLLIPISPVHFFFLLLANSLAPAIGHIAFDSPLFRGTLPGGDYFHYLHHRFVGCNFGTPTAPWDKVFNSFFVGDTLSFQEWKSQSHKS